MHVSIFQHLRRMVEEFRIEFVSPSGVYFPGQVVTGNVYVRLKEAIKARCVVVSIVGKARTHWTVWEQRTSNGKTHSESVPYWSEIVYADQSVCVWDQTAEQKRLPVGESRFPFSFMLPLNAPPTFEGSVGFIRYYIKAKIDRPWHTDNVHRGAFTVTPHFDLNTIPYAGLPTVKQTSKDLGFLLFKHGQLDVKVMLPKTGYVPGESIAISVDIKNASSRDVTRIEMSLIQCALCTADRHHGAFHVGNYFRHKNVETKEETRTVVQYVESFSVNKHASGTYQRMLAIPPVVPSFNICPIIVVSYYLKVKVIAKGTISNSISSELPLLIGTIPVRVANPGQSIEYPAQIAPPLPSAPPEYDDSHMSYGNCLFGKGNMAEDQSDPPAYTPKYIYYNNMS